MDSTVHIGPYVKFIGKSDVEETNRQCPNRCIIRDQKANFCGTCGKPIETVISMETTDFDFYGWVEEAEFDEFEDLLYNPGYGPEDVWIPNKISIGLSLDDIGELDLTRINPEEELLKFKEDKDYAKLFAALEETDVEVEILYGVVHSAS